MKKKRIRVGLTKYKSAYGNEERYELASTNKKFRRYMGFVDPLETFCKFTFESITGFKLNPGETALVTIHIRRVKK